MSHEPRALRVLLLLYPGCIEYEAMLAAELLGRAGRVVAATPDGQPHRSHTGLVWQAQHAFADADPAAWDALLIPGGDPGSLRDDTAVEELLRGAHAAGSWLGAICAGPYLLAKSGLLAGRRATHGYTPEQIAFLGACWNGVEQVDAPVVEDGRIITARPDAAIAFALTLAQRLGAIDAERAQRLGAVYRG